MAAAVGLFLAGWGALRMVVERQSRRREHNLEAADASSLSSPRPARERKAKAVAFLLNMHWQHGHMDVEGVGHALRSGAPLSADECWTCGRSRLSRNCGEPSVQVVSSRRSSTNALLVS